MSENDDSTPVRPDASNRPADELVPQAPPPHESPASRAVRAEKDWKGRAFLARLVGMDPEVILPKISQADPLGLQTIVMRRVRERALIFDPSRVLERSLLEVAFSTSMAEVEHLHADFLQRCVDRALDWLLTTDAEAERRANGEPPGDTSPWDFVYDAFGTRKDDSRRATVAFHNLPYRPRLGFFALLIDEYPPEQVLELGHWKDRELQMDVWICMQALGHVTKEETEAYFKEFS